MKCVIGIDPSINSTGICINLNDSYIYYLVTSKMTKKMMQFKHDKVEILRYDKQDTKDREYSDKELIKSINFYNLLKQIEMIIDKYHPSNVIMEGISYGSVSGSSLADLAGLNYIIRLLLVRKGVPFTIVSPTSLKKFVCANGQAEKDVIIESWKKMDVEISKITDIKIDDLADAFFLCNYTV